MRKYLGSAVALGTALMAVPAAATPGTYDAITDAVDWSEAITAMGAIAALLALVLVARKGFRFVLGLIK